MCKPFLTYDQQIDKLIKKGLTVNDKDHAIELLKNNSYFSLISGYKEPFKLCCWLHVWQVFFRR